MNKRIFRIILGIIVIAGFAIIGCAGSPAAAAAPAAGTGFDTTNLEVKDLGEFAELLAAYPHGVFANRFGEGIRTQIITYSFVEGNRVYFSTTSDKPFYAQVTANPWVSFVTYPPDWEPVLSLNGKVIFTQDRAKIEKVLEVNDYARRHFKSADNPLLRVFYIDVEIIETYRYTGAEVFAAAR
jgi:uncharacterized pyridoxamine 5'-phosphate oxidase family protein